MDTDPKPSEALPLLARLYRERRSGLLSLGPAEAPLWALLRDGQVVGLGPVAPPRPLLPRPDDSARIRLERVLVEVGIRPQPKAALAPAGASARDLRERLLEALADRSLSATFEEGGEPPHDVAEAAGATEPLILEAVRRLRDAEAVRAALGDLDQRLVATAALAEERTLTLTEGYLLSRIDGTSSARQVLPLVPVDREETEMTLLGLLLTGRVEYRAAPAPRAARHPETAAPTPAGDAPEPVAEPAEEGSGAGAAAPDEAFPEALLVPDDVPSGTEGSPAHPPAAELDRETLELRRQILEVFQSLPGKNHFEVLGVEPGCTDADVKRAYAALAKRYHPDAYRDSRIEDLHDVLEAIFIRVGEAWEVLDDSRSRASYEARSGVVRRPAATFEPGPVGARPPQPPPPPEPEYVPPEETLFKARLLLSQARYWEVIQLLESTVPQMQPRRHRHKGRILLAKACAKNPNWVRRAEEYLHGVVREDPDNVEAHYQLGLLYKQVGHAARAQAMFRRVVELRPEHREASAELGLGESPGGGGLLKRLFGRGKAS
jgi:tetratricopeptide (TPR) repeat protein